MIKIPNQYTILKREHFNSLKLSDSCKNINEAFVNMDTSNETRPSLRHPI
jgi:hypothetical protein